MLSVNLSYLFFLCFLASVTAGCRGFTDQTRSELTHEENSDSSLSVIKDLIVKLESNSYLERERATGDLLRAIVAHHSVEAVSLILVESRRSADVEVQHRLRMIAASLPKKFLLDKLSQGVYDFVRKESQPLIQQGRALQGAYSAFRHSDDFHRSLPKAAEAERKMRVLQTELLELRRQRLVYLTGKVRENPGADAIEQLERLDSYKTPFDKRLEVGSKEIYALAEQRFQMNYDIFAHPKLQGLASVVKLHDELDGALRVGEKQYLGITFDERVVLYEPLPPVTSARIFGISASQWAELGFPGGSPSDPMDILYVSNPNLGREILYLSDGLGSVLQDNFEPLNVLFPQLASGDIYRYTEELERAVVYDDPHHGDMVAGIPASASKADAILLKTD